MSTTRQLIIAVGDLVWDVLVKPDAELLPGGDTTGQIQLAPGGSAANVAAWIARAGMPAGFVGAVGRDVFGDLIVADLAREGVTLHTHRTAERDTGVILALIAADGQRSMVTNQGADFYLRPEHLPADVLRAAAHVHITAWSLFTDPPRAAAIAAAQIASAAGATVSFDPASYQMIHDLGIAPFKQITADMPVDIIFPNRDEAQALTGEREPAAMAAALRELYPGAIVALKLDRDGCFIAADDHTAHYPAEEAGVVVDTTGAGDAFNGGFLASYLHDHDLAAAARFANRVGAWVVARDGARPPADAELVGILGRK
jgi:ribokinase